MLLAQSIQAMDEFSHLRMMSLSEILKELSWAWSKYYKATDEDTMQEFTDYIRVIEEEYDCRDEFGERP